MPALKRGSFRADFLRSLSSPANFIGYMLLSAWLRSVFNSSTFGFNNTLAVPMPLLHLFVLVGIGLSALVIALLSRYIVSTFACRDISVSFGAVGMAGSFLVAAADHQVVSVMLEPVGFLLVGLALGWMTLMYQEMFAKKGIAGALLGLLLASLVGFALFSLVSLLPQPVRVPIFALLPLFAGLATSLPGYPPPPRKTSPYIWLTQPGFLGY